MQSQSSAQRWPDGGSGYRACLVAHNGPYLEKGGAEPPKRRDIGWRLRTSGRLVEVAFVDSNRAQLGGGVRGAVRLWSRQSRVRLLKRCAVVPWEHLGDVSFVTLTYPGVFPGDGAEVKRHMKALCKRWKRRFGSVVGLWKLEYQKRGAPHIHLAVRRPEGTRREVALWLSRAWYEVVNSGDVRHLGAGTRFEKWRAEPRKVGSYLGGYAFGKSKEYQHDVPAEVINVGRWWGAWGMAKRDSGFKPEYAGAELQPDVAHFVRRVLQDVHRGGVARRGLPKPKRRPLPAEAGAWAIGGTGADELRHQLERAVHHFLHGGGASGYLEVMGPVGPYQSGAVGSSIHRELLGRSGKVK